MVKVDVRDGNLLIIKAKSENSAPEISEYALPNVLLEKVVGNGANGFVLYAKHKLLKRKLAVKIWMKIKPVDPRNKFKQGLLELQKAASIETPTVAKVYDAGSLADEYVYGVFEFVPGDNCRQWLQRDRPNLLTRANLARKLVADVMGLSLRYDILHGDLHTENLIICKTGRFTRRILNREYDPGKGHPMGIYSPRYKIIDFGTSYFSGKSRSARRHWRIFNETINEILAPLDINFLWGATYPGTKNIWALEQWYTSFCNEIHEMITSFGMDLSAHPDDSAKWSQAPNDGMSSYPDTAIRSKLEKLVADDILKLAPETIGIIYTD